MEGVIFLLVILITISFFILSSSNDLEQWVSIMFGNEYNKEKLMKAYTFLKQNNILCRITLIPNTLVDLSLYGYMINNREIYFMVLEVSNEDEEKALDLLKTIETLAQD